ncbi:hypothetical protein HPB51_027282 [Rhipicephalus microplus]|uniref:Uncharacterized protein n=1 Tax=Rhipicephalus microplus TaxID=6941 RepID=A0A9J6D0T8_RHIMP|nr:hypothetical protein HPB51_027282 [Rhipicephalus microplus]
MPQVTPSVKLPKLELAKFNGEFRQRQGFCSQFNLTTNSNNHLFNMDKLMHLNLTGKAPAAVTGLNLSEGNHEAVLSLLNERFCQKKVIMARLVQECHQECLPLSGILRVAVNEQTNKEISTQSVSSLLDTASTEIRGVRLIQQNDVSNCVGPPLCQQLPQRLQEKRRTTTGRRGNRQVPSGAQLMSPRPTSKSGAPLGTARHQSVILDSASNSPGTWILGHTEPRRSPWSSVHTHASRPVERLTRPSSELQALARALRACLVPPQGRCQLEYTSPNSFPPTAQKRSAALKAGDRAWSCVVDARKFFETASELSCQNVSYLDIVAAQNPSEGPFLDALVERDAHERDSRLIVQRTGANIPADKIMGATGWKTAETRCSSNRERTVNSSNDIYASINKLGIGQEGNFARNSIHHTGKIMSVQLIFDICETASELSCRNVSHFDIVAPRNPSERH